MHYGQVIQGIFSRKLNRFVAEVFIDGKLETVHIKNTGRLKEILQPGAIIALETANNPSRKTRYSIIAAKKEERWINIDSQAPNVLAYEALQKGRVNEFRGITGIKRETTYEGSRFDLFYYRDRQPGFIEVKGVTLEKDGVAMFRDAPTIRGTKHVKSLIDAKHAGYEATVLLTIQMKGCKSFTPFHEMDPLFYEAITEAAEEGLQILAYDCQVTDRTIELDQQLPVIL